jgi:hypothetical protein
MTFERRNHGKGHSYYLDGVKLPGVTTVLDALRKRGLENWAGDVTAEWAVDHWDELGAVGPSARLDMMKRARWEIRDAAALNGTQIHDLSHRMRLGEPVEVPEAQMGSVQAVARFMDRFGVEPVASERPVWHEAHGWAGTFDLLAGMGGTLWLLDWKTGKGIYPEVALQLAAYAHAERMAREDGTEVDWTPPERCGAVHITADSAELYPVDAGDEAYTAFRYAQQVWDWAARVEDARKEGDPWPIGVALDPSALGIPA